MLPVYKQDARQLVRAGLAGGKDIPETITGHPCVFATLTAPSFGPVHSARRGNRLLPCRPRRDAHHRRCPHGRDISCGQRHQDDDPRLGRPLCEDCYDYEAAVLFNACAGALWRRFTTYLPRRLARRAGITQKQLRKQVRVRYVKVAEYQLRGVVHYHAVIRLDASGDDYQPPPPGYTADLLCDAITAAPPPSAWSSAPNPATRTSPAAARLRYPNRSPADPPPHHRPAAHRAGGRELHRQVRHQDPRRARPARPPTPHAEDIDALSCSAHYQQMIATAWRLGRPSACGEPLRKWAHMLGFGGHFLTKSRRYSVTFGQLRAARREHRRAQHHPNGERDPWGRPLDDTVVLILKTWQCTGIGYHTRRSRPGHRRRRTRPRTRPVVSPRCLTYVIDRRRSDVPMKPETHCLWTVEETARYLRVPKTTLYQWRYLSIGPKSGRVGRYIRYDPADVIAWFRQQQEGAALDALFNPPG